MRGIKLGILEFKPSDFCTYSTCDHDLSTCGGVPLATIANEILSERVASLPDVYTTIENAWLNIDMRHYKKRGKVLCVEENKISSWKYGN
jgi:hypothetical protein